VNKLSCRAVRGYFARINWAYQPYENEINHLLYLGLTFGFLLYLHSQKNKYGYYKTKYWGFKCLSYNQT
jgi:hypothetical protein